MSTARETQSRERNTPFAVLTWLDGLLILTLTVTLFLLCILRSRTRLLWADELLGDRLLTSSSLLSTMRGWWEGADGGGPLYYILGRLWMGIFGPSALSLRLFSASGMCAGIALVWTAARRYFSNISVAWSCAVVYLFASAPRWQAVNGRFYGLFMAAAAWASLCFLYTVDRKPSRKDKVLTGLAHGLLVGSHILGFVYSFSLIGTMILRDLSRKQFRPSLYLSAASGWSVLVISAHAIYRSTSITNGVFWTLKPAHYELFVGWSAGNPILLRVLLLLLLIAVAKLALQHRFASTLVSLRQSPAVWCCAALILAQIVIFLKSQRGISIYAERYLLPLTIITVFVFAACLDTVLNFQRLFRPFWLKLSLALVVVAPAAVYAFRHSDFQQLYPLPGLPERATSQLPRGAHVLVTLLPQFTLLSKYDPSRTYYFLLDWPYDSRTSQTANDYSGQREMENWSRAGYLSDRIQDCSLTFQENPDLFLMLDPGRNAWFKDRLMNNPTVQIKQLGSFDEWEPFTLWRIHRVSPSAAPC